MRQIYVEWYQAIAASIKQGDMPALEIGSGAGFMSEFVPHLITSDVLAVPSVDLVLDACTTLPFEPESLRAIAMVNVLHHLPSSEAFLSEAQRCLAPGGSLSLVEPWITGWSSLVYRHLHHEPCEPEVAQWSFESTGPLSGANQALPWIIFCRDRARFEALFPKLRIESIQLIMPIRYLVSGGVSFRAFAPSWSYRFWVALEKVFQNQLPHIAMFAHISVKKID